MVKYLIALILLALSPLSLADKFCVPTLIVKSKPETKQQVVKLNEKINLHLTQIISLHSNKGARVAVNAICQYLEGAKYTGSEQEWKQYIDNGLNGLLKAGYKDIELTLATDEGTLFTSEHASIEYSFAANKDGNKQVIYNLAVLDKNKNQLHSVSVSGNERIKSAVYQEFKRVLNTFEL